MGSPKKTVSFRLSEDTINRLDLLQKRYQKSAAAVIAKALYCAERGEDFEKFDEWMELPE